MGLVKGQWVSNPSEELIFAEGWAEFIPPEPPTPEPEPQTEPGFDEIIMAVKKMLATSVEDLSDEDALNVAALFPTFVSKIGETVLVGERLWYDSDLYKVLQQHTVQENWKPNELPALYQKISVEEWPEWVRPTGSEDAYNTGDKVTYEGHKYISTMDANIWSPVEYPAGWNQVE